MHEIQQQIFFSCLGLLVGLVPPLLLIFFKLVDIKYLLKEISAELDQR